MGFFLGCESPQTSELLDIVSTYLHFHTLLTLPRDYLNPDKNSRVARLSGEDLSARSGLVVVDSM